MELNPTVRLGREHPAHVEDETAKVGTPMSLGHHYTLKGPRYWKIRETQHRYF